ncbi:MAG TPA: SDR family NAD(P)-dependent oxidoreductase [Candidatus Acidoferrales bacterium]|jgi:NAD(P)-dependent dehydrogenase (short-subunit alcohol dehydrogenase family)|nr:SDR family NAD(P)-dependent oxidoreductase [Candidatus Acidoferrales bacterium]
MPETQAMSGKTCIITGANSGIGLETARGLARMGARVVLVCRNIEKGHAALAELQRDSPAAPLDLLIADISSQASVRALAAQLLDKCPRIDLLINNAGAAIPKRALSADGIEMTLAGNHLGAFLLTLLLLDRLKASAPARIVNVSSEAQRRAHLDLDDIQFERRKYSSIAAYGQSKVLMNACTFELARRLAGTSVTANCLHPGVVATNIWHAGEADQPLLFKIVVAVLKPFMLNSKKGAEVSLYLAASPDVVNVTGEYFVKSKVAPPNPIERDPKVAAEIWQWSEKMTGAHLA